jgi:sterol desaturase/sphingolipid hydroxylase (fatty acid hydroxylase superfamily)
MHHQATNSNYNVVFPLADYVLGTKKEPGIKDLRELMRLGYVKPQSNLAKKIIQAKQNQINIQRELIGV